MNRHRAVVHQSVLLLTKLIDALLLAALGEDALEQEDLEEVGDEGACARGRWWVKPPRGVSMGVRNAAHGKGGTLRTQGLHAPARKHEKVATAMAQMSKA